jgi:hypothetical protein
MIGEAITGRLDLQRTSGGQIGRDPREQTLESHPPLDEQEMGVPGLWHARAPGGSRRQRVALQDGHLIKMLDEDAGRAEAREAAANHHGTTGPMLIVRHGRRRSS